MKYTVTNDFSDSQMSSLIGEINTTYGRLVYLFGKPINGSGDGKVNSEWIIKFADGLVATIYDWKMPSTPVYDYDWHIGGHNKAVLQRIRELVE